MKNIKMLEKETRVCLMGGYEISYRTIEYKKNIYIFTVYNECNNLYVFSKNQYYKALNQIEYYEGIQEANTLNLLTEDSSYFEDNYLGYGVLPDIDNSNFYDTDYINSYLDNEINNYFRVAAPYGSIIDNLQNSDHNGSYDLILIENNFDLKKSIEELKESLLNSIDIYSNDKELYSFYNEQLKELNKIKL